jgi:tetratricopeptide (TPR) repeat protein
LRFLRGVAQTDIGKTDEAIATFTQLIQEYPELPEPYNNLAVIYASQNQLDKARTALEMAVRNNPAYAAAHENLGDIYARLAYQSYAKAQQLEANNPAVKSKLAQVRELFQPAAARTAAKPATSRP